VAIECVGVEAALHDAVAAVRKGGTVLVVGVHGHDAALQVGIIQDREICLKGTLMYQSQDFARAIDLLERGAVDVGPMIGARVPLERAAEGYATAKPGGRGPQGAAAAVAPGRSFSRVRRPGPASATPAAPGGRPGTGTPRSRSVRRRPPPCRRSRRAPGQARSRRARGPRRGRGRPPASRRARRHGRRPSSPAATPLPRSSHRHVLPRRLEDGQVVGDDVAVGDRHGDCCHRPLPSEGVRDMPTRDPRAAKKGP